MRFIGCKNNILDDIYRFIEKKGITGKTFCDIFSGTTCVATFFKNKGYKVISNDALYFSYVLQKAYIENNRCPSFVKLSNDLHIEIEQNSKMAPLKAIISYLNNLGGKKGFIYKNYSYEGTAKKKARRMYFSGENASKIDSIRQKIEEWDKKKLLAKNEYFILLASLIEAVPFISNISGTYGAFLKYWDPRARKKLILNVPKILSNKSNNKACNIDGVKLAKSTKCDILYIDPPYNDRQYVPNYHILETIALYDSPCVKGVTGMRDYRKQKSQFCRRETAKNALRDIAQNGKYKHLILSYNNEGIMKDSDIKEALSVVGNVGKEFIEYRRFKSHNRGVNNHKRFVNELLYYVNKET